MRRALAGTALVEQHHAIDRRVEELAIEGRDAAAGAAVHHDGHGPVALPDLLVVHLVHLRHLEPPCVPRLDLGVQRAERRHCGVGRHGCGMGESEGARRARVRASETRERAECGTGRTCVRFISRPSVRPVGEACGWWAHLAALYTSTLAYGRCID